MYGECISLYTLLKDMHISPVPRGILLFMGIGSGDRCGRKPGTPPLLFPLRNSFSGKYGKAMAYTNLLFLSNSFKKVHFGGILHWWLKEISLGRNPSLKGLLSHIMSKYVSFLCSDFSNQRKIV